MKVKDIPHSIILNDFKTDNGMSDHAKIIT